MDNNCKICEGIILGNNTICDNCSREFFMEELSDSKKKMPESKLAKTSIVKKKKELSFQDKVLIQLEMQNDKLSTIKGILIYFLCISLLSVFVTIILLSK